MTRFTATQLREMAGVIEHGSQYASQAEDAAAMLRQAADDAEDAERWRYAREHPQLWHPVASALPSMMGWKTPKDMDYYIDAARKENT